MAEAASQADEQKGKHGGARANSGGAREGAGRPKTVSIIDVPETDDPEVFLAAVMNGKNIDAKLRIDAAAKLMPYRKKRVVGAAAIPGEKPSKKAEQAARAEQAGSSARLAPSAPPRMRVVNE